MLSYTQSGISRMIEDLEKERNGLKPNVRFTTWDDYAVMSMVESGLGNAILPQLILKRVPYHILAKELDVPAYRGISAWC